MENLFGVPMGGLTIGMTVTLLLFLAILAIFASRNRVLLKLGIRNIPRRRAQTVLIIIGLMLSTAIIASALALGDTVSSSIRNSALDSLGATDITIEPPQFGERVGEYLTPEQTHSVLDLVDDDPRVDGAMPQVRTELPILNPANQRASVGSSVVGVDTARMAGFDQFRTDRGEVFPISSLGRMDLLLNEDMADELKANAGDELTVVTPTGRQQFTVAAVVESKGLAGVRGNPSSRAVGVMHLSTLQEALDIQDSVNRIEISIQGGLRPSDDLSDQVAGDLQLDFINSEVADQLFMTFSDPEVLGLIEDYVAENETSLQADLRANLQDLIDQLKTGDAAARDFRSQITDSRVVATVALVLGNAGRSDLTLGATLLLAQLEVLNVSEVKTNLLEIANTVGSLFTTIFGIFGSFSIMVGLLLIFLVFVMLAASRTTEMGIARAIGTKRRHLVQSFVFEGAVYAFASSIAGVGLGLLASLALIQILARIVPDDVNFSISYGLQPRSVLLSFAAGMVITLITVSISAYRVSRLNIAVAIRGLPEEFVPNPTLTLKNRLIQLLLALIAPFYQFYLLVAKSNTRALYVGLLQLIPLVWGIVIVIAVIRLLSPYVRWGWTVSAVGVLITIFGVNQLSEAIFSTGASVIVIGLGMLISFILHKTALRDEVVSRISYSIMGALLLVFWLLPSNALDSLTGELNGNIEMFVLSGVFVTAAAVWVVMYNSEIVLWPINKSLGSIGGLRPVLKAALAYPMESRFRTGLTVAMFALIVFTLMVFAVINRAFSNTTVDNTDRITGGYDIVAGISGDLPIDDIDEAIAEAPNLDPGDFLVVGGSTGLPSEARQLGPYLGEEISELGFQPVNVSIFQVSILTTNLWELSHFDPEYGNTDAEIWAALANDPDLVVAGAGVLPSDDPFGGDFGQQFTVQGIEASDPQSIKAFDVELSSPFGAQEPVTKKVIGIADPLRFQESSLIGNTDLIADLVPRDPPLTTYRFRLAPGVDPDAVSAALETAFLDNNFDAILTADQINDQVSANQAFNLLFQGYMGLGLLVGVASLGVVSFRAVVERRQAIGMLRAIGFRASMIRTSFLVESSIIALIGIGLGLALGAVVSWNLLNDINENFEGIRFSVPWLTVAIIVAVAWIFSLVTTYFPAMQASRIYPAEALRYE